MRDDSEVYVGLGTSKLKISVALASAGRGGEVRFFGDIDRTPEAVEHLVRKLAKRHQRLSFAYEAGPTGYGLQRQIAALGHDCAVVAPWLIPKRPGERVKANRRDALTLAKLHRAGELTPVWVPDPAHEALRELVRAREAAMEDLRAKRQHLQSFLLRHGRVYSGRKAWSRAVLEASERGRAALAQRRVPLRQVRHRPGPRPRHHGRARLPPARDPLHAGPPPRAPASAYWPGKNNRVEDHRSVKGRLRCVRGSKAFGAADRFCRDYDALCAPLRPTPATTGTFPPTAAACSISVVQPPC